VINRHFLSTNVNFHLLFLTPTDHATHKKIRENPPNSRNPRSRLFLARLHPTTMQSKKSAHSS